MSNMKTKEDFNNWTKGCECENSIGQTWCCNQCGLPYDTRKSKSVEISDGYHTMSELYEHRNKLFIVLCSEISKNPQYQTGKKSQVWRSKRHSDESYYSGWFIMGIGKESGEQITYHLPESLWGKTDFADTLEKAPQYDYHTSNDVLNRLMDLL